MIHLDAYFRVANYLSVGQICPAVVHRLPQLGSRVAPIKKWLEEKLIEHREHVERVEDDLDEVSQWRWAPRP